VAARISEIRRATGPRIRHDRFAARGVAYATAVLSTGVGATAVDAIVAALPDVDAGHAREVLARLERAVVAIVAILVHLAGAAHGVHLATPLVVTGGSGALGQVSVFAVRILLALAVRVLRDAAPVLAAVDGADDPIVTIRRARPGVFGYVCRSDVAVRFVVIARSVVCVVVRGIVSTVGLVVRARPQWTRRIVFTR
jgi:hypothetical protein